MGEWLNLKVVEGCTVIAHAHTHTFRMAGPNDLIDEVLLLETENGAQHKKVLADLRRKYIGKPCKEWFDGGG